MIWGGLFGKSETEIDTRFKSEKWNRSTEYLYEIHTNNNTNIK